MTHFNQTTAIALVLSLSALNGAQAFTQPNSVSPAYLASMASQAAAGRTASQTTIAPRAYTASIVAQQAAGKTASQMTIAAPAYTASIVAQQAAAKAASLATIAAPAFTASIVAQRAASKIAAQVNIASQPAILAAPRQTKPLTAPNLGSSSSLTAQSSNELASDPNSALQNALAVAEQATINRQIQASQTQSLTDLQNSMSVVQSSIFSNAAAITYNNTKTTYKAADTTDLLMNQ